MRVLTIVFFLLLIAWQVYEYCQYGDDMRVNVFSVHQGSAPPVPP